jgi:hypothetical protein
MTADYRPCPACDIIGGSDGDSCVLFARAFILGTSQKPGANRFGPLCAECLSALQDAHGEQQKHEAARGSQPPRGQA